MRHKPCAVALDFDKTLAYFAGTTRVPELLVRCGLDIKTAQLAYADVRPTGFSPKKMAEYLRQNMEEIDDDALYARLHEWCETSLNLYDDARRTIEWLEKRDIPWTIVTFGDSDFQRYKIDLLGLKPAEICVTSKVGEKVGPLVSLTRKFGHLVFVDDMLEELREVCRDAPKLADLCLIQREEGCVTCLYQQISSLEEIKTFFD